MPVENVLASEKKDILASVKKDVLVSGKKGVLASGKKDSGSNTFPSSIPLKIRHSCLWKERCTCLRKKDVLASGKKMCLPLEEISSGGKGVCACWKKKENFF